MYNHLLNESGGYGVLQKLSGRIKLLSKSALLALVTLLGANQDTQAQQGFFIESGIRTISPNQRKYNLAETDIGKGLITGANGVVQGTNYSINFVNGVIDQIPNNPIFTKPDQIGTITEIDPDSIDLSVKFGHEGWQGGHFVTVGSYFGSGRRHINIGESTTNKKYPSFGVGARIHPCELIFGRQQLGQFFNLTRVVFAGVDANVDFGNPTLFVPTRSVGGMLNVDIIGGMLQGSAYAKYEKEFEIRKPDELHIKQLELGLSLSVSLTGRRYDGTPMPLYIITGTTVGYRHFESKSFVPVFQSILADGINPVLEGVRSTNEFVNKTGKSIGLGDDILPEDIGLYTPDTIQARNDKDVYGGYYFGGGYRERLGQFVVTGGKKPEFFVQGKVAITPMGLLLQDPLTFPIFGKEIAIDLGKALKLGVFAEHSKNYPKKITPGVMFGKTAGLEMSVILSRRTNVNIGFDGEFIKGKTGDFRIQQYAFSLQLSHTFAPRNTLPAGQKRYIDENMLNKIEDPEEREAKKQERKDKESTQKFKQKERFQKQQEHKKERKKANRAKKKSKKKKNK